MQCVAELAVPRAAKQSSSLAATLGVIGVGATQDDVVLCRQQTLQV